jgi:predicted RNase H-like HicB family nuclease
MKLMTISVSFKALYHDIEGGGYWAEIKELPGCVAQADDLETLEKNLIRAIADWFRERPEKTEEEARELAAIQGTTFKEGGLYPEPYDYSTPSDWVEEDE